MPNHIAETAIVKDCVFGDNIQIWNFCNIYGCTIGDHSKIGSYTEIQSDVIIGENSIFF